MARSEPLGIWLHDRHVASITARRPWQLECRYAAEALDAWPKLRTTGAMSIAGRWELAAVTMRDLVEEAVSWRVARRRAVSVVAETVERAIGAVEEGGEDATGVHALVAARARRLLASG